MTSYSDMSKGELISLLKKRNAPAVQVEPVAYAVFADNGNIRIWCAGPIQAETLRQEYGDQVRPLYAAPQPAEQQPAPDVAGLVEALEWIAGADCEPGEGATDFAVAMGRGIAIGNIHRKAAEALAAYRNQGGES